MRVDKWLWAVRQYKTRTQASKACDDGRVSINDQSVKASRLIGIGDEIAIRRTGIIVLLKVIRLTENRLNAKLVPEFREDRTPPEVIAEYKARIARAAIYRDPGSGRPTKRERRDLDDFLEDYI